LGNQFKQLITTLTAHNQELASKHTYRGKI